MKKKQPISKDEALIMLQSQPLSANLWRIVSDQPEANFIRFPDASFIDSQSWPTYISKKQKSSIKTIEETREKEVVSEDAREDYKIEQLKESPSEEIDNSTEEEINQSEIVSENKVTESMPGTMNLEKVDIVPVPDEEIVIPVATQNKKRSLLKIKTEPEQIIESKLPDTPIKEVAAEKSKTPAKSLDFYEWLEELKQADTSDTKKPKARKAKPKILDKGLEATKIVAENSLKLGEEIVSETLARLLARQGHREEAIEMYQKLILKYPEKEATFAAALQKLKS